MKQLELFEEKPREWTQEEVTNRFMEKLVSLVHYWELDSRDKSTRGKLFGLLHSFLVVLDGGSELPAFEVIPTPHISDKEYLIDIGENYYRPFDLPNGTVTVGGNFQLHELLNKYYDDYK